MAQVQLPERGQGLSATSRSFYTGARTRHRKVKEGISAHTNTSPGKQSVGTMDEVASKYRRTSFPPSDSGTWESQGFSPSSPSHPAAPGQEQSPALWGSYSSLSSLQPASSCAINASPQNLLRAFPTSVISIQNKRAISLPRPPSPPVSLLFLLFLLPYSSCLPPTNHGHCHLLGSWEDLSSDQGCHKENRFIFFTLRGC